MIGVVNHLTRRAISILDRRKRQITVDDILASHYSFMIFPSPYRDEVTNRTLTELNARRVSAVRDNVDEATLFIARILRNYDTVSSERTFILEFDHFLGDLKTLGE